MAKKHQVIVKSKKGRGRAGRKWRRQEKETLRGMKNLFSKRRKRK